MHVQSRCVHFYFRLCLDAQSTHIHNKNLSKLPFGLIEYICGRLSCASKLCRVYTPSHPLIWLDVFFTLNCLHVYKSSEYLGSIVIVKLGP